ncbi:MAG: autotransporter domain-containing protein, partial [Arenimonas sp.]
VSSGNNQSAPTSTTLPAPLVALAKNNGINARGVNVNWAVTAGSATLSTPSSVTDVNGLASVNVTLGATPGTVTITGTRADDGTAIATFTATATLVRTLTVSSGNNQSAPTSTTLPAPLVALAKNNGINASGVTVNWAVTSGSATLSTPSSVTDVNGLASVNVTLGPTAGPVTITGTRADDASAVAVFTLTSTLVRSLVISSGNNQTAAPGTTLALPFVVLAKDNGNPAFGVGINWTVASGSGSLAPPSSTTNTSGNASSTLTLGTAPGAVTVTASRSDDPTVRVTFAANAAQLAALSGLKPEAAAVARAIDQFCPKLPSSSTDPNVIDLRKRCLEMIGAITTDPAGVGNALDELFADVALVQSEAGLLSAQSQFENIKARIAALRSGTRGTSFGGLAINASGGQLPVGAMFQNLLDGNNAAAKEVGADFSRWGFFAAGTFGRGNADPGVVSPGYDFDINGFTAGADYRHSDKLIFGGSLGYTRQNNDLNAGEGKLKTRGWSASAYGTFYKNDSWYSDAMLSYGRNSYLTERRLHYSITLPGGGTTTVDQLGRGDSSGNSLTLAGSFGRDFNKNGWGFGPYFRALYTRLDFDPLTEHLISGTPGSGLALAIDTRNVTSLTSTLGGKLTYARSTTWGVVIPHVQLEWQHEFRTDPSAVEAHFLYDPTATPFTITGDAVDSDFFRFGVGMSFVMTHGRSGFFYYEKLLSRERFSQDSLAIGLRLEF